MAATHLSKERKCPVCNGLVLGRRDKKFCSSDCKSSHYHATHNLSCNYVRTVNKILSKNRRILRTLNPSGKSKSNTAKMLSMGFNFQYFTNVFITKSGKEYKFCYDYGYVKLDNDEYVIVRKQEYV